LPSQKKLKKKKEDDDEDEEKPKKKEEPKFPESSMDFDGFKKEFMNSKDRKTVLADLWEKKYDDKAFSIYYIRYQKLEKEGKVLMNTVNMRDYFIQSIDAYRKHSFGTLGVYGVDGNYELKGLLMWRGKGIPFFMEALEQFEYYDRKELDPRKEEDRKVIENYWLNLNAGEVVEGIPAAEVETFK